MKKIKIIHISGSTSSGKTTIGNIMHKKYPEHIIHIDIDSLSWMDKFRDSSIRRIIESCNIEGNEIKIVLLCGILYDETSTIPYKLELDRIYSGKAPESINFHKLFLKISSKDLLKRYYFRTILKSKYSYNFWKGVAKGEFDILSSCEKMIEADTDLKWHVNEGYKVLNEANIIKYIESELAV